MPILPRFEETVMSSKSYGGPNMNVANLISGRMIFQRASVLRKTAAQGHFVGVMGSIKVQ